MAVPAGIPSIAQQEMAVNAKIARHQEKGRVFSPTPEKAEDQWASFKTAAKDFGIGIPANVIGMPADLVGMVTMAGYSGLNWVKGGDFTLIDFTDIPGTSENIGKAFGADTKSGAFLASAFTNPEGGVLKAAAVGKAMFIGARALTDVSQGTLAAAKSLEKLGGKSLDVWKETGWFKDGDDWKFILSDEGSVIEGGKLDALMAAKQTAVGKGGTVSGTLGELFQHDALYKAYPQLRDVPVHFDFIRQADDIDGNAVFKMSSKRQRSVSAMTEQKPTGSEVTIFKAGKDRGRQAMLHEVQHLVQQIEGFDHGTSSAMFRTRITNATEAHADKIITHDIASGKIDVDSFLSDGTYFTYLEDLSNKTGVVPETLEKALEGWLRPGVDIDVAMWHADTWAATTKRDLRIMMEETAQGLHKLDPKEARRMAEELSEGLTYADALELSFARYTRQAGEVEARLTEILRDFSQEKLAKMTSPTELADVPAAQRIIGDAARAK